MLLYQKRGLQSWNCSIVQSPPPYRELFTQRISRFSNSRFLCCHLVEINDVITEGPSGGFLWKVIACFYSPWSIIIKKIFVNSEWYVCRDTWKQKVIFSESLNLTRNRHFFSWNLTFGSSLQGVLHPFKAPKGSKALLRWGYFRAWNTREFLKGNIWKCDEHLRESMQTLRYHRNCVQSNALFRSHDTWRIESSRAAVKGTKPKLQDRRVHLPHCSSRKFTCNGSLQRAVSIFTAVCTKSRQYRVWEHKKSCAVGGVLLYSWEMLLPCSFSGNTTWRPSADDSS